VAPYAFPSVHSLKGNLGIFWYTDVDLPIYWRNEKRPTISTLFPEVLSG
jgi:hypothetical protein